MQALYAFELGEVPVEHTVKERCALEKADPAVAEFARRLVDAVLANTEKLDAVISQNASNWKIQRVAIIDKNILRIAICEILYFDDIPPKVSIDEAIEIAKDFSTEKSSKFINGVLDPIAKEIKGK